ncbi:somatomedin-B and thrombospondin type-1 domain-containing protein [Oncorhynchus nerka]|uniref:somatomedin-B and thrombospondin type-1 domain-containing protein n=1 Tax=Oncorhynchus nerka TaxID=8023 RepID=UPI0031B845C6
MASVAYVLLLVAAVVLGLYHILVEGGCAGKCCGGSDITCVTADWRMDRVYRACYCDEGCLRTKDCCYDYPTECPAQSCVVTAWSHWSGCAQPCQRARRNRQRHIVQEPKNSGDPCPNLEEQAGCMDYQSHQGEVCSQNTGSGWLLTYHLGTVRVHWPPCLLDMGTTEGLVASSDMGTTEGLVLVLTTGDPASSTLCGVDMGTCEMSHMIFQKTLCLSPSSVPFLRPLPPSPSVRFCMEYKMESLTPHCRAETRPHARWMQYLREGHVVCVACRPPAMRNRSGSCQGDGQESDSEELLHWLAVGNSRCRGTWKKVQRTAHCSCPHVHSFLFI